MPTINLIVSHIVELSLEVGTGDSVRDIYSVMMDVSSELCRIMNELRQQERKLCQH